MIKIEKVSLSQCAQQRLLVEINGAGSVETGGVLCGYYSDDLLVVDAISGPGPNAFQTLTEFVADKEFIDQFIDNQYMQSAGRNIYIGEWHSHPQMHPVPSPQDLKSFIERTYEWNLGEIAFIIVGFVGVKKENLQDQTVAILFDKDEEKFFHLEITF